MNTEDQSTAADDHLTSFHPLLGAWFREQVGTPTPVQQQAWPVIRRGGHCLITAPTGTGKTLAAFLTAIDGRIRGVSGRILYISPLKALNSDIERNLQRPLQELRERFAAAGEEFPDIRIGLRSGDTDSGERRRLSTHPPDILVTTPESLNLMLSSQSGRQGLRDISVVILDEIHAILSSKRGTYLMSAVERLTGICGEFQRIALSATVRPLDLVAEIVGGFQRRAGLHDSHGHIDGDFIPRPLEIVEALGNKRYELELGFPENGGVPGESDEWWRAITRTVRERIESNSSTIIFANSRRMVEKLARMINDTEGSPVYAHHGSLSREIRRVVEERLKRGELKAIIATGSLELGIDIGEVDEVILIQSPFTISSGIQRVGRAGHGVGEVSRALLLPLHSRDLIDSAVMSEAIRESATEAVAPPEKPLDVLAQIILSMSLFHPIAVDEISSIVRCIHAYRDLNRRELELVIDMLAGRFADSRIRELNPRITRDRVQGTIQARKGAAMLLYMSGGVIPDRGFYTLRRVDSGAKIGELDEEFVWERSLGEAFPFGNKAWRITRISPNEVEVLPAEASNTVVPFWRADDIYRPAGFCRRIGEFLEQAEKALSPGGTGVSGASQAYKAAGAVAAAEAYQKELEQRYAMSPRAAAELCSYLQRQREHTGCALPHRHHLVVECYSDPAHGGDMQQVVLHTMRGGAVNKPFALAIAAAWRKEYGFPLEVYANNDAILCNLPHDFQVDSLLELVDENSIPQLLRDSIEGGPLFGARFRENAQRSLLLPRRSFNQRTPLWLTRMRSKKLLEAVSREEDFPITLETWRECLRSLFDLPALYELISRIRSGVIAVSKVTVSSPSPFVSPIIWRQTNYQMYLDDSAAPGLRTSTGDDLLREILDSPHLRPEIPADLSAGFQRKLQRCEAGYAPDTHEDLLAWIDERLFIPLHEWEMLCAAVRSDNPESGDAIITRTEEQLEFIHGGVIARERRAYIAAALGWEVAEDREAIEGSAADEAPSASTAGSAAGADAIEAEPSAEPSADAGSAAGADAIEAEPSADAGSAAGADAGSETAFRFLSQWLRYYAPLPVSSVLEILPASAEHVQTTLEDLAQAGVIIVDRFSPACSEDEVCERENLDRLLRMRRAESRPDIEPLSAPQLQLFLAQLQGVAHPGSSPRELEERLELLFGYPVRADLWEAEILPCRLNPYYGAWLDTALRQSELLWFGSGRQKVSFAFETDIELFAPDRDDSGTDALESRIAELLAEGQKYAFLDLATEAACKSSDAASALWSLVWRGLAYNDGMDALRQGIAHKFTPQGIGNISAGASRSSHGSSATRGSRRSGLRGGFNRWQATRPMSGIWAMPPWPEDAPDPLEESELIKDRIRVLFARYGILCRELLWNEAPALQWSQIQRTLRLMELSGEIYGGSFIQGLRGLQFISPAALRMLGSQQNDDAVYWINAADPASLCGIDLDSRKGWLPPRVPSTHLVFHGEHLVMISRKYGRELTIDAPAAAPRFQEYLGVFGMLLSREQRPRTRIRVEQINSVPAHTSEYAEQLRAYGFVHDGLTLSLWKKF